MSLFDRIFRPAGARIEPVGTEAAAQLAAIHASGFARPWSTLEFEHLLGERGVIGDGLYLGREKRPSGFALSRIVLDEAEILTIAIAREARGRGHSRPLLTQHLDGLSRKGVAKVHLEVEEGNTPALALYRRLGFKEVGRRAGYYLKADGTRAAALTMAVDL
ncbi:GNAT family N-acetyltransferase [Microvirga terricola]|uniref:GNAT family N-acetyltransferase n=1 Tax=Microvirga terricola TaxID=2719797 RepID=A0ABX0V7J5_9HYPH|nr:GNAT family N-acetyltransferase [Microvirga terricola]NIX75543.1 GNAT family N-acetyltransferase [Microvirga terricola]